MPSKKKICYIISNVDKAIAFEWIVEKIDKQKFELTFMLLIPNKPCFLEGYLKDKGIIVERILLESKKDYPSAIFKCRKLLKKLKTDMVHCHLRDANIIGLIAAKTLNIRKRIYTRHHSSYHHEYFPKAVKLDKLCNYLATDIIAISLNVKNVLQKENVPLNKIHLIHHGFKLESFLNSSSESKEAIKSKYLPKNHSGKVIGVISRYMHLKGHSYIIDAAKSYLKKYPDDIFVFANANGTDKEQIKQELKAIPPTNYIEIPFEENLFALYQLFDTFIHVPINTEIEAFGQTYVEALAAGVPSIFTLSGVAPEFISHKKNAWVVPFKSSKAIYEALCELRDNHELREQLRSEALKSVQKFNLKEHILKLEKLYL